MDSRPIRDWIKSLRRVRSGDLIPHPSNWRRHGDRQTAAMRAALTEIGYAGALLVRETGKGLQLIDGHLRAGLDPEQKVPVLVLDVTAAEAEKLLATLDPIAGLAEVDTEALSPLAGRINFDVPDLADLVASTLGEPLVGAGGIVEDVALGCVRGGRSMGRSAVSGSTARRTPSTTLGGARKLSNRDWTIPRSATIRRIGSTSASPTS